MSSSTDDPRPSRPPRRTLVITAIAAGAVVAGTVAAIVIHQAQPHRDTPVQLGSKPAANQVPRPARSEQIPAAPDQSHSKVGDECFGTTPKPGSTPARPLCDWDRVFADTDARARALRQQQHDQFKDRADALRRSVGETH